MILEDDLLPNGSRMAIGFEPVKSRKEMLAIVVKSQEWHWHNEVENPASNAAGVFPEGPTLL